MLDSKQFITAKLEEAGITLPATEIDELVAVHPRLQAWRAVVQGMLQQPSEPAISFSAQPGGRA